MDLIKNASKVGIGIAIFCALLGSALLVAGIIHFAKSISLWMKGVVTVGTMVDKQIHYGSHKGANDNFSQTTAAYYPIITFTNQQNETLKFLSKSSIRIAEYQEGKQVAIIYNPHNPANTAEMNTFEVLWGTAIGLFVFGGILIGIAYIALKWM